MEIKIVTGNKSVDSAFAELMGMAEMEHFGECDHDCEACCEQDEYLNVWLGQMFDREIASVKEQLDEATNWLRMADSEDSFDSHLEYVQKLAKYRNMLEAMVEEIFSDEE